MKQKIKLNIGNRIYPLNVNTEQEEVLRKAAKEINDMITKYEKSYAVKDKQDSLAMCALEIFTNNKKITMDQSKLGSNTDKKLSKIIELIDQNPLVRCVLRPILGGIQRFLKSTHQKMGQFEPTPQN